MQKKTKNLAHQVKKKLKWNIQVDKSQPYNE